MTRIPLTQGAYMARSIIASAQRSVNLYAEKNPDDSPSPFTHYGAPGLTTLADPPSPAPGRCLYMSNIGKLYYVCGDTVYYVSPQWVLTALGTINSQTGIASMADNGTNAALVDGTTSGWQINLTTNVMTQIDGTNNAPPPLGGGLFAFYGADRVDAIDGFLVFNQPGTRNFYSTYFNEMIFDSLYFAAKNGYSDDLVTIIVTLREIWLIGQRTTEIWFNAGDPAFPFQIYPGTFIQHGCIAKYSVAQVNGVVFFLSQDQAGTNIIVRGQGHEVKAISNPAMEYELSRYPVISDAEGFCFTIAGHAFYQINFPAANKSWRWDERTPGLWAEVVWTDSNGGENRHRAACAAFAYGVNVCADWETGRLYKFDLENHTDAGMPMQWRRGWPHSMKDGRRVIYPGFVLDVQAATSPNTIDPPGPFPTLGGPSGVNGSPSIDGSPPEDAILGGPAPAPSTAPVVFLRWSDDRGRTYGNPVAQTLGATGRYLAQPSWNRCGSARDRVWECYGVIPGKLAINGAFLDPEPIVLAS